MGTNYNTENISLTEAYPPTFFSRPKSITTFVGKAAKFLCTVTGTPVIETIWQKDGMALSPSPTCKISDVDNKHILELSNLTVHDKGVYSCKASNKFGADTCQAELDIIDKPHFIKELEPVQSAINKKIRLEGQVDEDRKVTITWSKNGQKLPPGKDYKIYFEDKIASLEIPLAKLKDSGTYVCTASNEAGSSSTSATVTVRGKKCVNNVSLPSLQGCLSRQIIDTLQLAHFVMKMISSQQLFWFGEIVKLFIFFSLFQNSLTLVRFKLSAINIACLKLLLRTFELRQSLNIFFHKIALCLSRICLVLVLFIFFLILFYF